MTLTATAVQERAIAPLPKFEPIWTTFDHDPKCYYLTAMHPDKPAVVSRLMVLMGSQEEEVLVDLSTNATDFMAVMKVVRTHEKFKSRRWSFIESWEPVGDCEPPF